MRTMPTCRRLANAGKLGNLRQHKYVLILFWFYVLLTLFVLRRFRDQAARKG